MIKKLFLMTLLTPTLAYSGEPSIDLSVPAPSPGVPFQAAAAGFTTLAYNADFSTSAYATHSSPGSTNQQYGWLGCVGDPNFNQVHEFAEFYLTPGPCDINQTTDPTYGGTVMDFRWKSSYDAFPNSAPAYPLTQAFGGPTNPAVVNFSGPTFPLNAYYEATYRTQTTPSVAGPSYGVPGGTTQWWTGWYDPAGKNAGGWEVDVNEQYWAWTGPTSTIHNWANGNIGNGYYGSYFGNYDVTQYHTWGLLLKWDGTTLNATTYLDNVEMGSGSLSGGNPNDRQKLIFSNGISCTFTPVGGGKLNTCVNAAISAVYNCGGAICITTPSDTDTPSGSNQAVVITGATSSSGVLASILNKQWNKSPKINNTDWQLTGSTWPSNADAYTAKSATMNPYTSIDAYVKSIRVWSCPNWATSQCIGG
jgi:hypothetical protein